MLPKTVSENLDLTLQYRSINLNGSVSNANGQSVFANGFPLGIWPKMAAYASNAITSVANTSVSPTSWTLSTSPIANTFASAPIVPLASFITTTAGNITIVTAGYYTINTIAVSSAAITTGSYWNLQTTWNVGASDLTIASSSETGATVVTGETLSLAHTVSKYIPAGTNISCGWSSTDAGLTINILMTIIKIA